MERSETNEKLSKAAQNRWSRPGEVQAQSIRMQQMWDRPGFRARRQDGLQNGTPHAHSSKGRIWITNGVERQRVQPDQPIPEGWRKGKEATKAKQAKIHMKGSVWITDDHGRNRRIEQGEEVPAGWRKGRS